MGVLISSLLSLTKWLHVKSVNSVKLALACDASALAAESSRNTTADANGRLEIDIWSLISGEQHDVGYERFAAAVKSCGPNTPQQRPSFCRRSHNSLKSTDVPYSVAKRYLCQCENVNDLENVKYIEMRSIKVWGTSFGGIYSKCAPISDEIRPPTL